MVTEPPVTSAAARNGPALDRSGSTVKSPRFSRPGRTRQRSGRAPGADLDRGPGVAEHPDGHLDVRQRRAPAARSAAPRRPPVNRGAASSSPETSCEDPEASSVTGPPGTAARAVHGERQRAAAAVVDRHAERAQRGQQRADRPLPRPRVAVERDRRRGERRHRGQEPHDRSRVADVDADRRARARAARVDADVRAVLVDGAAEGAQRPDGQGGVAGLQHARAPPTASRSSAARMSARLVIDFEPGSRSVARTGPCAAGARQRPESITLRVSADARWRSLGPSGAFAGVSLRLSSFNPACTGPKNSLLLTLRVREPGGQDKKEGS